MAREVSQSSSERSSWPQYSSRHRLRSHEEAHAEAHADDADPGTAGFDHALVPAAGPMLVTDQTALEELIRSVRTAGQFGYDSEFIGEQTYYPRLCLVQVATAQRVALIDPLGKLDLRVFWEVVADPTVEKIVHAGLPDLEPVVRHLGRPPQNIFDTQMAAAFAGLAYPMALDRLIQELISPDLLQAGRRLKFSQWDHRPLSPAQLQYAASDVRYLPLVRHRLKEKLQANNNADWAAQECTRLSNLALYQFDAGSQRVRVRGVGKLSRRKRALLRALLQWRENAARQHDVPPRSLLRDDVLMELASSPARSLADLDRVRGLPRPVEREYGEHIVEITRVAMAAPPPPPLADDNDSAGEWIPDSREHRSRVEELWEAVRQQSAARSIDPGMVTSKKELAQFVAAAAAGRTSPKLRVLEGWRAVLLGPVLGNAGGNARST